MSLPLSSGVLKCETWYGFQIEFHEFSMTQKPENSAIEEEIILPENLLSLGSVLAKA